MSKIQIKAFFKFCRVKIVEQVADVLNKVVTIKVKPEERYHPVCHRCKKCINTFLS
jgi:hypothetical protein